jgi:hypothetical protein
MNRSLLAVGVDHHPAFRNRVGQFPPQKSGPAGNDNSHFKSRYKCGLKRFILRYQVDPLLLAPLDFIAQLVALAPKPRVNLTRFHSVFAPNIAHRVRVIPAKRGEVKQTSLNDRFGAPDSLGAT